MRTTHAFLITLIFDSPARYELRGRIRDVASDAEATFQSAHELVSFLLAQEAASAGPAPPASGDPPALAPADPLLE
jgi:hypothetical protein